MKIDILNEGTVYANFSGKCYKGTIFEYDNKLKCRVEISTKLGKYVKDTDTINNDFSKEVLRDMDNFFLLPAIEYYATKVIEETKLSQLSETIGVVADNE